jgi:peptide/nickel transport system substrate-binding protein
MREAKWYVRGLAVSGLALALAALTAASYQGPPELVFVETGEASSLDPLRDLSVAAAGIDVHVFDQLVDYEGPGLKLVSKLAVSWDNPSPLQWRFKLRPGVRFHDGAELTADDVKFTFEAAQDAKSLRKIYVTDIEKVEAVDKLTVVFTTKRPLANMLSTMGQMYILPRAAYERMGADAFGKTPIGTGRYKVGQWDKGQRLVLEANERYWGGKVEAARLVVRPISEATTRVAELRTGRAHIVKSVPVEMVKELESDPVATVVAAKGIRQVYYPLNTLKKPFDDVRVRRALNYAVDREAIVKYVLDGRGEVRTGPLNPRAWGFDPSVKGYEYNPTLAKKLLDEAGYPNGVDITWNMTKGVIVKDVEIAEAFANQLGKVGVRVKLNVLESGTLFQKYYAGDFEASITTWSLTADPDNLYTGLRIYSPVSKWYQNPAVDKLIEAGRNTVDTEKRLKVYQELYRTLVEDAPWLMMHAQDENYGVSRKVNWKPYPFLGIGGNTYFVPLGD